MEAHTEPEQQHAAGSQASDRIHVVIDAFRYLQTYRVTTNIMFNHMDVKILDEGHVTQRNKAIWDVTIRQWNCNGTVMQLHVPWRPEQVPAWNLAVHKS
jgi:hypothetical protein